MYRCIKNLDKQTPKVTDVTFAQQNSSLLIFRTSKRLTISSNSVSFIATGAIISKAEFITKGDPKVLRSPFPFIKTMLDYCSPILLVQIR